MHVKVQLGQLGQLGCTIKCSWVRVKMQLGELDELGYMLKYSWVSCVSWVAR